MVKLSPRQFARLLGVTPTWVKALRRRGMPQGHGGWIDVAAASDWIRENVQPRGPFPAKCAQILADRDFTPDEIQAARKPPPRKSRQPAELPPPAAEPEPAPVAAGPPVSDYPTDEPEPAAPAMNGSASGHALGGDGLPDLAHSNRRLAQARADKAEAEAAVRRGELVDARAMGKMWFENCRAVRDALLQIPNRVSAQLAATKDPHKVRLLLEAELRSCLMGLAAEHAPGVPGEGKPRE